MITALLGLLGGLLADAGQQNARRGRLHELSNRLGLRAEQGGGDLRSRLEYLLAQPMAVSWEHRQAANAAFFELLAWLLPGDIEWIRFRTSIITGEVQRRSAGVLPSNIAAVQNSVRYTISDSDHGTILNWYLPTEGVTTRYDKIVGWLYRQIVVALSAWPDPDEYVRGRTVYSTGVPYPISEGNVSSIVDWVIETGADIGPLSFSEAMQQCLDWHHQFKLTSAYRNPVSPALVVVRFADGSHIDRLITNQHFVDEGAAMGHCIGGQLDEDGVPSGNSHYYQQSRDGKGAAFSYRDAEGVPQATLYLDLSSEPDSLGQFWDVDQLQGPDDEEISDVDAMERIVWLVVTLSGDVMETDLSHFTWPGIVWRTTIPRLSDMEHRVEMATRRVAEIPHWTTGTPQLQAESAIALKRAWIETVQRFLRDVSVEGIPGTQFWFPDVLLPTRPLWNDDTMPRGTADLTQPPYWIQNAENPLPVVRWIFNVGVSDVHPDERSKWHCELELRWPPGAPAGPTWTAWRIDIDKTEWKVGQAAPPEAIETWTADSFVDLLYEAGLDKTVYDMAEQSVEKVADTHPTWWPDNDPMYGKDDPEIAVAPTAALLVELGLQIRKGRLEEAR